MKQVYVITLLTLATFASMAQPKVYVNYVSHNETNYVSYLNDSNAYVNAREKLIQFANDCQDKGAKWSYGSDYIVLDAIKKWDYGALTANTDGKNLLKWLNEDRDVSCDPHAHANIVPNQDVAYKHTLLGVEPSSVMSGSLYLQADDQGYWWDDYQVPVQSTIDENYSWAPEIIWGSAVPGHDDDPLYHGLWKPNHRDDFFTHNASNHLIAYGNGCKIKLFEETTVEEIVEQIDDVLASIEDGSLPANGFYPMSIFIRESDLAKPSVLIKLGKISDSINVRIIQNKMEWMHIVDIVELWKNEHNSEGFYVSCDKETVISVPEIEGKEGSFSIYPNPANTFIEISAPNASKNFEISIINISGKLVRKYESSQQKTTIQTGKLPKGIYFIKIKSSTELQIQKIIIL